MKFTYKELNKKINEIKKVKFNLRNFTFKNNEGNCSAFVTHIFKEFDEVMDLYRIIYNEDSNIYELKELKERTDFCLVLMSSTDSKENNHVGIYVDNKIIHMTIVGIASEGLNNMKLVYRNLRYFAIKNKITGELLYV